MLVPSFGVAEFLVMYAAMVRVRGATSMGPPQVVIPPQQQDPNQLQSMMADAEAQTDPMDGNGDTDCARQFFAANNAEGRSAAHPQLVKPAGFKPPTAQQIAACQQAAAERRLRRATEEMARQVRAQSRSRNGLNLRGGCVLKIHTKRNQCYMAKSMQNAMKDPKWTLTIANNVALIRNEVYDLIAEMIVYEHPERTITRPKAQCKTFFKIGNTKIQTNGFGAIVKLVGNFATAENSICKPCGYRDGQFRSLDGSATDCSATCDGDNNITAQLISTRALPAEAFAKKKNPRKARQPKQEDSAAAA
ncbi:hypothetical protein PAPHI01_0659 [Pancytospora philotis]|nr:hypothetical protein PAPHI01_0659 [Pancytospora philotis]